MSPIPLRANLSPDEVLAIQELRRVIELPTSEEGDKEGLALFSAILASADGPLRLHWAQYLAYLTIDNELRLANRKTPSAIKLLNLRKDFVKDFRKAFGQRPSSADLEALATRTKADYELKIILKDAIDRDLANL